MGERRMRDWLYYGVNLMLFGLNLGLVVWDYMSGSWFAMAFSSGCAGLIVGLSMS